MKWKILLGTVVLGIGLSSQSFGFDLLDRMLGASQKDGKGSCGCSLNGFGGHAQKGGDKDKSQQGEDGKGKGGKGCGLGGFSLPRLNFHSLGCSQKGGDKGNAHQGGDKGNAQRGEDGKDKGASQKSCGLGGFSLPRLNFHSLGCSQKGGDKGNAHQGGDKGNAQRGEDGKGKGASQKGFGSGLLDRLFACNVCGKGGKGGKGASQKGSDSSSDASAGTSPMPPAPVVDPSAFLQTRRPVIQATSYLR